MNVTSPELIHRQLQLALRAARQSNGAPATWAFAAYAAQHPAGERYGAAWWAQTIGGERVPLTTELLHDLEAVEAGVWIWGQQVVMLSPGPLQGDGEVIQDLLIHTLVTPRGVTVTPADHSEIRARTSAREALWSTPIICVVRGPRPNSWPL